MVSIVVGELRSPLLAALFHERQQDPYFPHGVIDLRYAISCDPIQERTFRIRTNQKIVTIMADSVPSRDEWVKAIRKVIFKAQNMGDSVKVRDLFSSYAVSNNDTDCYPLFSDSGR